MQNKEQIILISIGIFIILLNLETDSTAVIPFILGCLLLSYFLFQKTTRFKKTRRRFYGVVLGLLFLIGGLAQIIGSSYLFLLAMALFFYYWNRKKPDSTSVKSYRRTIIQEETKALEREDDTFIRLKDLNQRTVTVKQVENLYLVHGISDVMVDFGQTIIMRGEHQAIIHKLGGNIKLIVPKGVDIEIRAHVFRGQFSLPSAVTQMNNQNETYRLNHTHESPRKLIIHLFMGWGDIEVIPL